MYVAASSHTGAEAVGGLLIYFPIVFSSESELEDCVSDVVWLGIAPQETLYDVIPREHYPIFSGRPTYPGFVIAQFEPFLE